MNAELDEILRIARDAAAVIRGVYSTAFVVEMKGPSDPVTRADREANDLICERLAASFPGEAIVAEESVPSDPADLAALVRRERVFFVDPLDGTAEFAQRNGEFAVMIGLAHRGRAIVGAIVMPESGDAMAGALVDAPDADRADREGDERAIAIPTFLEKASGERRPLRVSSEADPKAARLMVSRSHRPPIIEPLAARLGVTRTIPCGSVGVKVAHVILGDADLYVHDGLGAKRWDSCAPEAILAAAGGRFTDLDGALIDYADPDIAIRRGMIASNGALHAAVVDAARAIRKG